MAAKFNYREGDVMKRKEETVGFIWHGDIPVRQSKPRPGKESACAGRTTLVIYHKEVPPHRLERELRAGGAPLREPNGLSPRVRALQNEVHGSTAPVSLVSPRTTRSVTALVSRGPAALQESPSIELFPHTHI